MAEAEVPTGGKRFRIALVDDHDLARAGLRDLLTDEPSVEVVGEASNGREAVELCHRLRPDLVLMDVRMPQMDGLEATRAIKRDHPRISILMVTTHADSEYLLEALKAGAAGYILKEASADQLISAVLRVLSGESPMDPDLSARLLRRLVDETLAREAASPTPPPPTPPAEPLTPRELEVLSYVAQGLTNPEIAQILFVRPGTVKNHVEHILAKLEVSDRTQAAVKAHTLNLITSPPDH